LVFSVVAQRSVPLLSQAFMGSNAIASAAIMRFDVVRMGSLRNIRRTAPLSNAKRDPAGIPPFQE
jgi:hypothetical protein